MDDQTLAVSIVGNAAAMVGQRERGVIPVHRASQSKEKAPPERGEFEAGQQLAGAAGKADMRVYA